MIGAPRRKPVVVPEHMKPQMDLSRRQKMELLRAREAARGQQSRVASIILQKVLAKHGTGKRASEVNNAIKAKVEEFTRDRQQLDPKEFARLDSEVAALVAQVQREIAQRSASASMQDGPRSILAMPMPMVVRCSAASCSPRAA